MLVRTRRLLPLAVLLLIASPAFAGTLVTYAFDSSSSYFTNAAEGWENSYCADTWTSALNGGVCPKTDDGCNIVENCGGGNNCGYNWGVWQNCTASDPIDNHIQFGSNLWEDYIFSARMKNDDNDTFGFVFRYKNSGQYYLFFLSREYAPTPGGVCPQNIVGSRLFRIHGSEATSLAGSSTTYTQGAIHEVRITVVGGAITIEFDANSNGAFEANEKIISVVDANPLPAGRVGFYAYDNGATAESACVNGGCWFDDLEVDVLGLADDPCNGVSWEGQCDGNTLKYCEGGQVHTQQCQCCTWFQNAGYYACAQAQYCQNCTDECSQGQWGCSDTLSHAWTCGQSDNDPCLERTWTVCDETGFCDPIAGECAGAGCVPSCQGKQCGPDGCGGSCGSCPAGSQCGSNGQCACVPSCGGKQCGPDGCGGSCGTCDDNESCTVDSCTKTGT